MPRMTDKEYLTTEQYADSVTLNARVRIHGFGTNTQPWFRWVFDQLNLQSECRILELGAGPGGFWRMNAEHIPADWEITVTDISPGMVSEAEQNLAEAGHTFLFRTVDAEAIPFQDESFDAVIALHTLYHLLDLSKALSEMHRALRPGGRLYTSAFGRDSMRELQNLVRMYLPGIEYGYATFAERFGIENGGEILGRFFTDVEFRRYEDSLMVPEVQPVIDYILSGNGAGFKAERGGFANLTRAVEAEIEREGCIRISKDGGIFITRKPSEALSSSSRV